MTKISLSLSEYRINIDDMIRQYENIIQNLSIPFIVNSNSSNLRNLNEILLTKYKNEIGYLNKFYNKCFESLKNESEILIKSIKGFKEKLEYAKINNIE